MTRILIVTDAWQPQVNGVVRCLTNVGDELKSLGHDVRFLTPGQFWTVPMPTYPEIRLSFASLGHIEAFVDGVQPDCIHIATEGPLGLLARQLCMARNVPFTTSYHTRFAEYLSARVPIPPDWGYAYLRWFHEPAKRTLAPTKSISEDLRSRGFENIVSWTRGVDATHFVPGEKTQFTDLPGPHLLYVGRVSVEKNIQSFLTADVLGTKIVVGDGPQLEELRYAFPHVQFLGHRSGKELVACYQSADVFVFPSKTDTFGNVMIEAMASGTPVAAYPTMGPIDVLTDPEAGAMHDDLSVAIKTALTLDRGAARRHALTFTWRHCAEIFFENLQFIGPQRKLAA